MKRNRREFEVMVRACHVDLYRYAYWLCGDPATAEDLVQETLLRGWRSMGQLREPRQVRAWLITTLRREHARLHVHSAPPTVAIESLADSLPATAPEPDMAIEARDLDARLALLPRDYREPLVLQVLFGYTIEEIATMLELTAPAVYNRLWRARRQLLSGGTMQRGSAGKVGA